MITRNFNLYLNAGHSIPLVINANQAEEGEQWVFSLFQEDGTPYIPTDGSIVGIKSDGYLINNSGTVVDGKVVIAETRQMTAAAGKSVFELRIDGLTHGTANFIVLVENDPTNGGIVSDSDLSLIEEALSAVSPLPTGGTVGQVLTKTANGSAWSDAGTPTQEQVAEAVSDWADENITVSTGVVIDTSLAVAGAAADSKKVGDELNDLKSEITQLETIPYAVKMALDTILHNIPFKNTDIYTDELATFHAWATSTNILSISAVFNQGSNVISTSDTLDSLRQYLTVTASYSDGTSGAVSGYTLSGELNEGTNTITVAYEGKTATFNVDAIWILQFTGSDLIRGYLADTYASTDANGDYCTSYEEATSGQKTVASKRLSMATFIPIEYGYSYIFKWKATKTLMLSAFAYSESAMTKYANLEAWDTSTERASLSGGWNAGTSDGEYMVMTGTPTENIGTSPVATMRFNFKTDPEVAFSENKSELTEMIITREVVS